LVSEVEVGVLSSVLQEVSVRVRNRI
jgi:hypothetical protein